MNLDFSETDQAFRTEVRTFIRDNTPSTIRAKIEARQKLTKEDYMALKKIMEYKS